MAAARYPQITEQERRDATRAMDQLVGVSLSVADHAPAKARSLDSIIARLGQWIGR